MARTIQRRFLTPAFWFPIAGSVAKQRSECFIGCLLGKRFGLRFGKLIRPFDFVAVAKRPGPPGTFHPHGTAVSWVPDTLGKYAMHVGQSVTRFGVIGTGRITRRLVADLQSTDGVAVTAIASRSHQRAQWCAEQYGIAAAVEGYDECLRRDDVDAVYLSLPPSMHAEWSIAAANRGKHVLCEKPLATSLDEAKQIDDACRQHHVRWLDATGWMHHDRTAAFRRWLADDTLGTIGHVSASVSFFEPFQSDDHRLDRSLGGGCLLDLGWYVSSVVCLVMDHQPISDSSMTVRATSVMRQGVPIRVSALVSIPGGITATLSCGYDTATRKWFEIAGSKASLICDDFTRPWHDRPTRCWIHDATGKVESSTFEDNQERRMIAKLASDEDLGDDQRRALQIQSMLDAMEQSCQHDGQAVQVKRI